MGGSEGNYEKSGSIPLSGKTEVTRRKTSPWGGQLLVWERGAKVFLLPSFGQRIAPLYKGQSAKDLVKGVHILGIILTFKAG